MRNDELMHYGVLGMKWGQHRARNKNAHNKNYSDTQRKNDRALYGQRGEKRINKRLNEGYGLRGARHFEVERRERTEKRKKSIKKAASRIGTAYVIDKYFNGGAGARLVGSLAGSAVYNGRKAAKRMMQYYWDTHPDIL